LALEVEREARSFASVGAGVGVGVGSSSFLQEVKTSAIKRIAKRDVFSVFIYFCFLLKQKYLACPTKNGKMSEVTSYGRETP
jgi:hypothetical protein